MIEHFEWSADVPKNYLLKICYKDICPLMTWPYQMKLLSGTFFNTISHYRLLWTTDESTCRFQMESRIWFYSPILDYEFVEAVSQISWIIVIVALINNHKTLSSRDGKYLTEGQWEDGRRCQVYSTVPSRYCRFSWTYRHLMSALLFLMRRKQYWNNMGSRIRWESL